MIGGLAVGVHGVVRAMRDMDIVPDPDHRNLERLATVLRELDARQIGVLPPTGSGAPASPPHPQQIREDAVGAAAMITRLGRLKERVRAGCAETPEMDDQQH